jgi:putative transposase
LVGDIVSDLEVKVKEICEENEIKLEKISIMPDHIHLFVSAKPTIPPHKIVKLIKGCSSRYLRDTYPNLKKLPCMWSPAYYVGTVGFVSESVVNQYIENQKSK